MKLLIKYAPKIFWIIVILTTFTMLFSIVQTKHSHKAKIRLDTLYQIDAVTGTRTRLIYSKELNHIRIWERKIER